MCVMASVKKFRQHAQKRDATLDMPMLILPAVQNVIFALAIPEFAEANGISYLKIPFERI